MTEKKLFVASENEDICDFLTSYAQKDGFKVKSICEVDAQSHEAAIRECVMFRPDIVILGPEYAEAQDDINLGSLMTDVYVACEKEGGNYLRLPFDIAQLDAVFARHIPEKHLSCEDMLIEQNPPSVLVGERRIPLSLNELEVLKYLVSNPNRVFSREQLAYEVFGADAAEAESLAESTVGELKEKLDGLSGKWSLKLLWGVGYKFEVTHL